MDYALPLNIEGLERDLKKYRIVYDNWFRESTIHEKNETKLVVDKLMETGHAYEQDGAVWFKATEYGLDKDFVLRRSNGLYTYIVPDITTIISWSQEISTRLSTSSVLTTTDMCQD